MFGHVRSGTISLLMYYYYSLKLFLCMELGDITILSFIMILKCHDNWYRRETFSIVISSTQYYHKYHDHHKIDCSQTCTSVKCCHLIFTILVAIAVLSDIVIITLIINKIFVICYPYLYVCQYKVCIV